MTQLIFLPHSERCPEVAVVAAEAGDILIEVALSHGINIEHACELACACTTCQVIVREGFDSLDECFGDMAPYVQAVETGLSSDPTMNLGVSAVAGKTIVSFSDAHSLPNMGRELTVFEGKPAYYLYLIHI